MDQEQIGSPANVYEHPESEFVAGFVGVSNVLERNGRRFTVRPEEDPLLGENEEPAVMDLERGRRIREVVYVGMVTPGYVVDLENGGSLARNRQNLETTSADVVEAWNAQYASSGVQSTPTRSPWGETEGTNEARHDGVRPAGSGSRSTAASRCWRQRAAAARTTTRGSAGGATTTTASTEGMADRDRRARGSGEPHQLGRYVEKDWVTPFETETGLQGQLEGRRRPRTRWSR